MKKKVSGIMLTLLLISMLTFAFYIQPVEASGTIYIRANGSVDPPDAPISTVDNITYIFSDNIYNEIVVERSNIIVDGNRCTLQGSGSGYGFSLTSIRNVTVKNINIKGFSRGVCLESASNNTISRNNITNNHCGFVLSGCDNNILSGNKIANNNDYGVWLHLSSNNILSGNKIANNNGHGIVLYGSSNTLSRNMMNENRYNFKVLGFELSHFMHSIDVSNLVDGKPVYYLVNQTGLVIHPAMHPQVGYLALVRCSNVTVEDLTLTKNGQGLLLAYTNNSTIADNNITNNYYGVRLYNSSDNSISGNNITNNSVGVFLEYSSNNNIISANSITNNSHGVWLYWYSESNILSGNNITNNNYGVLLSDCDNNIISGNSIASNGGSVWLSYSESNILSGNNITNNKIYGVQLDSTSNSNKFYHNNFVDNSYQVFCYDSTNVWDDDYPSGGNYWSDYNSTDFYSGPYQNETGSDGIGDTPYTIDESNTDHDPLMNPWTPPDIAVMKVTASTTIVGQGMTLRIDVTVTNQGNKIEGFDAIIFANRTFITSQTITLKSGNSTTVTFPWDTTGVAKGNYTISAHATIVPEEIDTADNTFTDGWVVVTIAGDIDGDSDVDFDDIVMIAMAYGSKPGHPNWNPNADIDCDDDVDFDDVVIAAMNYGKGT